MINFSYGKEPYSLRRRDVEALFDSSDKIALIQDVEASYDSLMKAFVEFNALVYKNTLESLSWTYEPYKEAHKTRVELNIALASVLNSGRAITDALGHSEQEGSVLRMFDGKSKSKKRPSSVVKNAIEKEYDSNVDYFLMYFSRQFLQPSRLVVDRMNLKSATGNNGRVESKLLLFLDLDCLKKSLTMKVERLDKSGDHKRSKSITRKIDRLNAIKEPVHILSSLDGYMNSIGNIICAFRGCVGRIYNEELKRHQVAVEGVVESVKHLSRPKGWSGFWFPPSATFKGKKLPLNLEWNLVEHLTKKNSNPNVILAMRGVSMNRLE